MVQCIIECSMIRTWSFFFERVLYACKYDRLLKHDKTVSVTRRFQKGEPLDNKKEDPHPFCYLLPYKEKMNRTKIWGLEYFPLHNKFSFDSFM